MRLYYVVNARLPNKKAYGIQIAKMCEAFIEAGVDLILVIPQTRAARQSSMRAFYGLRVDIPTVTLPTFDWYDKGRIGYAISSLIFATLLLLFFLFRRARGLRGVYYSIPDTFSFAVAALAGFPCVVEIHEPKPVKGLSWLISRAKRVIATNGEIERFLVEKLHIPRERLLLEPNGVDMHAYVNMFSKEEAHKRLGIPAHEKIALYLGRLYEWKGLDILAGAAEAAPDIQWYVVGGSIEEFRTATKKNETPSNLHIAGECAPSQVPIWLALADVLLVLGTKRNETSFRFTSPMKTYEYMAARRPVIASATPALQSSILENCASWYQPDDARGLADVVRRTVAQDNSVMVSRAAEVARGHSWSVRAQRIQAFIRGL